MDINSCKTFLQSKGITDAESFRKWIRVNHPDKIRDFESLDETKKLEHNAEFSKVCEFFKQAFNTQTNMNEGASCSFQGPSKKTADCVREVINWSKIQPHHIFDSLKYNPVLTKQELPIVSPKMRKMFDKIRQLDERDRARENKLYKHFIFSDLQGRGHGSKIIAAALQAEGYQPIYRFTINQGIRLKQSEDITPFYTFGLISSTCVFGKPFEESDKKQMLSVYNDRQDNVYGQKMRILVMDSKFKEGIDLFDVKYVHIFEESKNQADLTQVIGRATRFCGQKGLNFVSGVGWKLNVYIYKLYDILPTQPNQKQFLFEKYRQLSINGVNIDEGYFMENVEKLAMLASVDYQLNFNMHAKVLETRDSEGDVSMKETVSEMDELIDQFSRMNLKNNNQLLNMSVQDVQKNVLKLYKKFQYGPIIVKDECNINRNNGKLITLSNTQEFVSNYLRPNSEQKGMLLWHSVGTGKTCTAIAVKSHFEMAADNIKPFHVLWVTKTSLVNLEEKNMFDEVCHAYIREKLNRNINTPRSQLVDQYMSEIRKRGLIVQSMTYKRFSNALSLKNDLGQKLSAKNGTDLLKNTLVIIDEAHKLYADDFTEQEKPNVDIITQKIHKSYELSGQDSCKVLLMTATPMVNGVSSFVNLMNLIIEKQEDRFDIRTFREKLCTPTPKGPDCSIFSESGKKYFYKRVKGLISFLDRRYDPSLFAQPVIKTIEVEMSKLPEERTLSYCNNRAVRDYEDCKNRIDELHNREENQNAKQAEKLSVALLNIEQRMSQNKEKIDRMKRGIKTDESSLSIKTTQEINKLQKQMTENKLFISNLQLELNTLNTNLNRISGQGASSSGINPNQAETEAKKMETLRAKQLADNEKKKLKAQDKLQKCMISLESFSQKMADRARPPTDKMKEDWKKKEDAVALCKQQIEEIDNMLNDDVSMTDTRGKAPMIYEPANMETDTEDAINDLNTKIKRIQDEIQKFEQINLAIKQRLETLKIQYQHQNERHIKELQDEITHLAEEKKRLLPLLKMGQKSSASFKSCNDQLKIAKEDCAKMITGNIIYQDVAFSKCMAGSSTTGGKNKSRKKIKAKKITKRK